MIACLTELSFRSATYPAYSPVDITCLITASASFSSVAVFKIAPGPEVQLSVFSNPESDSVLVANAQTRRSNPSSQQVALTTTLLDGQCQDSGTYQCRQDSGNSAQGEITITAPLVTPTVTVPDDIISNKEVSMQCEGVTDPGGSLFWSLRAPGRSTFSRGLDDVSTSSQISSDSCSVTRQLSTRQVFDMSWNNTEVRCDVSDPAGNSVTFPLLIISEVLCAIDRRTVKSDMRRQSLKFIAVCDISQLVYPDL
ncbi:hypothetical protein BaRGS_00009543 [Batillaria attramentaria]|uniref:Ig-like domain-containing protein n=1 Tax=Batillaria attramentaria TaxID=370345 RepID=A0ABD0LIN8_9CAEN